MTSHENKEFIKGRQKWDNLSYLDNLLVINDVELDAYLRSLGLYVGEKLWFLLHVVSQGFFCNDGLSCNSFCIGMLRGT